MTASPLGSTRTALCVRVYFLLQHMAEEAQEPDRAAAMRGFAEGLTTAQWQALADLAWPGLHDTRRRWGKGYTAEVLSLMEHRAEVGQLLREAMRQALPTSIRQVFDRVSPATISPDGHRRYTDAEVAVHDCESCGTSLPDCDASVPCCGRCRQTDTHRNPSADADDTGALGGRTYRARYRGRTAHDAPLRPCRHCDEPAASCVGGAEAEGGLHACCRDCSREGYDASHPGQLV